MRPVRLVPLALAALLVAGLSGCAAGDRQAVDPQLSVDTLHPAPEDYARRRIGTAPYTLPPHAKFLKGVRICLNPGHGGDAAQRGFKRGPTGVREAEVNLRVALYLADLLRAAGAEVLLTRTSDVELRYAERARIGNEWPADLFIALHHNAISSKPEVNYTTVWYHETVDHRPSNLDLARYLSDGLIDALGLELKTAVPLKSDQLMYADGFAVLRHAEVTAALTESSFYTNPEEEQRLRRPEYNLREAYGLFVGLCRYALAGLPRAALVDPPDGRLAPDQRAIVLELDDGLRGRGAWGHERCMILRDTLAVRVNGEPAEFVFDDDGTRYELRVELPPLATGTHEVEVQFQNMYKNSVLNPHLRIQRP